MGRASRRRTRSRSGGSNRAFAVTAAIAAVALVGWAIWKLGIGGPPSGSTPVDPPPAPRLASAADGVRVAHVDVDAWAAWCEEQDLPAPPRLAETEPAVAEALRRGLAAAASERSAAAFGHVGRICEALDSHGAAEEYFRLALAEDDAFVWRYHLGCVLQGTGRNDEAVAELERARAIDPEYPLTWTRLGQLYLEGGRLDEAAAAFERYAALVPTDWLGSVGLGRVALRRGEPAEALSHLERAEALRADDFQVQFYLGRAWAALGDRERATRHLARADSLPQGAWFRARDPLEQELHRASNSVDVLQFEFERLHRTQDWERLATLGEEILRRRSGDVSMMGNVAGIYRKLGRYDEAHAMLDRAMALRPESMRLGNLRAEIYLAENRFDEAIAATDAVLESDAEQARAWGVRGRALIMLERGDEAEAAMRRCLELGGEDASNLFVLGEILRATGDTAGARSAYERVAASNPEYPLVRERLAELQP